MLDYWASEMQKIESFRLYNKQAAEDDRPIGLLGFTQSGEEVELHVLSTLGNRPDGIYADFAKVITHREQMGFTINQGEEMPLWGKNFNFDNHEIYIKGGYGGALVNGQLKSSWILSESLRQGWSGRGFENYYEDQLNIQSYKLDMPISQLEEIIKANEVTLVRDTWHKRFLVEAPLSLPVNETFEKPVILDLSNYSSELKYEIAIHSVNLRDIWQDFKEISDYHKSNHSFDEETFEAHMKEQEKHFEALCPRDMRIAVVTYEAVPELSIECHTTNYLNTSIKINASGSASAMSILVGLKGEKGNRGLQLRTCVMYEALSADTKMIDFEVFSASLQIALNPVIFK